MPRNTFILVSLLAIVAALIVGVNTGRSFNNTSSSGITPSPLPTGAAKPGIPYISYRNTTCGISFSVPEDYRTLESSGGSTLFINKENPTQSVTLLCQKPLPAASIASGSASPVTIGTVSAILSTGMSGKGSPVESLDVTHPGKNIDIRITAPSAIFKEILKSVTLL